MIPVTCRHCGRENLVRGTSWRRAGKCPRCGYHLHQRRPEGYRDGRSTLAACERSRDMLGRLWHETFLREE